SSLSLSRDGRRLVSRDQDRVCAWDLATNRETNVFPLRSPHHAVSAAVTPDGKQAIWPDGKLLHFADLSTGKETLVNLETDSRASAVSADGKLLIVVGDKNLLHLWDLEKRRLLRTIEPPGKVNADPHFSPDGRLLALGDLEGPEVQQVIILNVA